MIINVGEVKEILNITETTYDNVIANMIPLIQDDITEYCNTFFQDENIYLISTGFEFNATSTGYDTIVDPDSNFLEYGFVSGIDICIEGGFSNVGIYETSTITANTITLKKSNVLIEYTNNLTTKISRVKWPISLKLYVSRLIWHNISQAKINGIKSKSLGPSSVVYDSVGAGGYPANIMKGLDKYKCPRVV